MLLKTAQTTYRLTVLGYQFPDAMEPYDANWLLIGLDVSSPEGEWSGEDACLLTYEAARLADWIDALAAGQNAAPALSFLEPVLLFRVVESAPGQKVLRAHFGNLIYKAWETGAQTGRNDLFVDFPLGESQMLSAAAQELRQALKRYPQRGEQ